MIVNKEKLKEKIIEVLEDYERLLSDGYGYYNSYNNDNILKIIANEIVEDGKMGIIDRIFKRGKKEKITQIKDETENMYYDGESWEYLDDEGNNNSVPEGKVPVKITHHEQRCKTRLLINHSGGEKTIMEPGHENIINISPTEQICISIIIE